MDFGLKDLIAAKERVYRLAYATPLVEEDPLSARFGGRVLSKLENLQYSGSFKIRGAANKVLSLDRDRVPGVVAASAGNHARGVARAAKMADLFALAEEYEKTLGVALAAVKERVEKAQSKAAHTALDALDDV